MLDFGLRVLYKEAFSRFGASFKEIILSGGIKEKFS